MMTDWQSWRVLGVTTLLALGIAACGGSAAPAASVQQSPQLSPPSAPAKPGASGREEFQAADKAEKPGADKAEKPVAAKPAEVSNLAPVVPSSASPAAAAASSVQGGQAPANDIRGIYVYSSNVAQISGPYAQSVSNALTVSGVDGLVLVAGWDALEPAVNQFQWGALDQWLGQATNLGRKVELAVIAGSDTPAWLFQVGAKSLSFTVSPHSGKTDKCDAETVAPPWDQTFLGQWDGFLGALAAHLKSSGTYDAVKVVRLTGINRTTDELRLPAETPQSTHLSCVTDSVATWQQAGYRPSLLAQAWDGITSSFQKSFPDKVFSVAIIPENPFPPIGDNGAPIKAGSTDGNQPLLALASKKFPGHLAIQMNFLMPGQPASPAVVKAAQTLGSLVAFQTNNYLGSSGQGAACAEPVTNPTPCTASTYLSLLQTGIYPDGQSNSLRSQYIEVFPANALAFPDAVQQAHSALIAP